MDVFIANEADATDYINPESLTENLIIKDITEARANFGAGIIYVWIKSKPIVEGVNLSLKCGTLSLTKNGDIEGQWKLKIAHEWPLTF